MVKIELTFTNGKKSIVAIENKCRNGFGELVKNILSTTYVIDNDSGIAYNTNHIFCIRKVEEKIGVKICGECGREK